MALMCCKTEILNIQHTYADSLQETGDKELGPVPPDLDLKMAAI